MLIFTEVPAKSGLCVRLCIQGLGRSSCVASSIVFFICGYQLIDMKIAILSLISFHKALLYL